MYDYLNKRLFKWQGMKKAALKSYKKYIFQTYGFYPTFKQKFDIAVNSWEFDNVRYVQVTSPNYGTNCESFNLKYLDLWWDDDWDSQELDQENTVACKCNFKRFISRLKHKVKR